MPFEKALAAGLACPGRACVRGAGVQNDRLVLLNANAHNLEVLRPPRLELLVNEELPCAGLQDGLPLLVGAGERGGQGSQAGAGQLGCLLAIGLQLLQNDHCGKGPE